MSLRRPRSALTSALPVLLVGLVMFALAAATGSPASASPPTKRELTAITAMPSKVSEVRRDADGERMTQKERDAQLDADPPQPKQTLGNSDGMGTPADKTLLESDVAFRQTNTFASSGTNSTTASAYSLKEDMSGPATTPVDKPLNQRSIIDQQYRSVGGHFLDATHMGVLDFKQQVAGDDALFSLAAPNQSVENWSVSDTYTDLTPGTTYVLTQDNTALTNSEIVGSKALNTQARSENLISWPNTPDPSQLWTVVDTGNNDGSFSLVNRADGLCLVWSGQFVGIDTCTDDESRHWDSIGGGGVSIFPVGTSDQSALGSDGGTGVPDTLGANTNQSWLAYPLNEQVGSPTSWSTSRTNGNTKGNYNAPYDLAAGDLDGVVTQDYQSNGLAFHDEAAVAWADASNNLQIRVVDYNANASHLLVTAPSPAETIQLGSGSGPNLGDVVTGIGDFDGDGTNELAVGYQTGSSSTFTFNFYDYRRTSSGGRALTLSGCSGCNGQQPFASTANISDETGYADLTVGDFDGDGSDDMALGFATWASATNTIDHYANLGLWTLNRYDPKNQSADLTTRSVEVTAMPTNQGTLPRALSADGSRTQSGIRVVSGNLMSDPENGFGPQRSEIAMAYDQYTISGSAGNVNNYKVEPVFGIYSGTTTSCNNSGTTCETVTTMTNGGLAPTALFPSHPSQTTYRDKGVHFEAAPISLAVGGFGGQAATDPPVDGLLASTGLEGYSANNITWYQQDSIVVPWSAKDQTSTEWTITDTQTETGGFSTETGEQPPQLPPWKLHHYTGYDRLGQSLVLGAPAIMNIEQEFKLGVLAGEPPTQVDWLNNGWSNISASSAANLTTQTGSQKDFTSDSTSQNSWAQTFNEGFEAKASFGAYTYFGPNESGYVDGQQKFSRTWSGLNEDSQQAGTSWSVTTASKTNQDDAVSYSFDDSVIYRYPVLGAPGQVTGQQSCQQGCTRYYNVLVPKGSTSLPNVPGQGIKNWFQPSWSNMNALSYPAINADASDPVPMPDAGSFTYTDTTGTHTVTDPLYNSATLVGSNSSVIDLDFSTSEGASSSRTSSRTTDNSVGVTVSGTISWGAPVDGGDYTNLSLTASAGYDKTNTITDTTTGTNVTSSSQSFELNYPGSVLDDNSYYVGTAFYYGNDGSAKVVHGVDLTDSVRGQKWWNDHYGVTPDPALNLPGRISLADDPETGEADLPFWNTAPQRQLIRQFQTVQATADNSGLPTAGDPLTGNALAGQKLNFSVPIHNYSLADMSEGTDLAWWAVPVDGKDDNVTGDPIKLGTSTVPAIKAQGVTTVQSPTWTAAASSANTDQQYRIVVQVDPAGTAADMHPLGTAATACPDTSLEPTKDGTTPVLYDIMKKGNVADPLGCGQDNQGYGLVTVSPANGVGAERHATPNNPARARLAGGGLIDGNDDHLELTATSPVPTVTAGQRVTGIVRAKADLQLNDHPVVLIYDGPVSNNKLVGVTALNGIDDQTGGLATFDWTPDKPGLHELHQVLLSTRSAGQDDEQIMRVNVQSLAQYKVKASSSRSSVPLRGAYTISGTVSPVPDTAYARTVQLQQKVGDTWKVIDTQQTSSSGRFDFDLLGTKSGTQTYRVWKIATAGRHAAVSAPIKVLVGGFVVTAKASTTKLDLGKSVTFAGTAKPAQGATKDRTVDLQRKSGSSWKTVATGRTTASGSYTLKTKPTAEGSYSYRVTKRATATLPAASSPTVSVRVTRQFSVTAKAKPTSMKLGHRAKITGTVTPHVGTVAARKVQLQLHSGTQWKKVASATTRASGAYTFSVKPTKKGTYHYRVAKLAAGDRHTAYSPHVKVKVTKR